MTAVVAQLIRCGRKHLCCPSGGLVSVAHSGRVKPLIYATSPPPVAAPVALLTQVQNSSQHTEEASEPRL